MTPCLPKGSEHLVRSGWGGALRASRSEQELAKAPSARKAQEGPDRWFRRLRRCQVHGHVQPAWGRGRPGQNGLRCCGPPWAGLAPAGGLPRMLRQGPQPARPIESVCQHACFCWRGRGRKREGLASPWRPGPPWRLHVPKRKVFSKGAKPF